MRNMTTTPVLLLLLLLSLAFCCIGARPITVSSEEYDEMKKYLGYINRPGVKTIRNVHGEVFDCVDIFKQPAFDHSFLKDHRIQMEPSFAKNKFKHDPSYIAMKTGFLDGGCPLGTVPLKRVQMKDLLRAGSVSNYVKKKQQRSTTGDHLDSHYNKLKQPETNEYAVASMPGSGLYHGTRVTLNVWNPQPDTTTEGIFSLAQLWLAAGSSEEQNTIEAGWIVYPEDYDNDETHLFIYWTADEYNETGCYNLRCPGFVQVDRNIMPEMILSTSVAGGNQAEIRLVVLRDDKSGYWWLSYEDASVGQVWIGYWPSSLFTHLAQSADRIDWGGETDRSASGSYPPMGSGSFPSAGYGYAAYASRIQYVDTNNTFFNVPYPLIYSETQRTCYLIQDGGTDPNEGRFFIFGGPGGADCTNNNMIDNPRQQLVNSL